MDFKRKPKLVIALLTGATLALLGGGAVAATLPGPNHMMQMMALAQARQSPSPPVAAAATSEPSASATAAASTVNPPAPVAPTSVAPSKTVSSTVVPTPVTSKARAAITYVVKPGDTLSGIATWFQLHGYGDLYAANAAMIGADPNLIKPGERITIGDGVATMVSPA